MALVQLALFDLPPNQWLHIHKYSRLKVPRKRVSPNKNTLKQRS